MVWGEQQVDRQQSVPEISRLHGIRFCMYYREQDSKVPHCRALCAGESYTYVTDTGPRTVSTHPRLDPIPSTACAGCSGCGSVTVGRTLLTSLPSPPLLLCPCMDRTGPGRHPGRLARPVVGMVGHRCSLRSTPGLVTRRISQPTTATVKPVTGSSPMVASIRPHTTATVPRTRII